MLLLGLVVWLVYLLVVRVSWLQESDEYNLREWLDESRVFRKTTPELVRDYLDRSDNISLEALHEQLRALANPVRIYQGQLPLFPEIYHLEIRFDDALDLPEHVVSWGDSPPLNSRHLEYSVLGSDDRRATLHADFQLHAFDKRQHDEDKRQTLLLGVGVLAGAAAVLVGGWIYFFLKREQARDMQRVLDQQQIEHAERLLLQGELERQETQRKQEEMERHLLEQRLATQAAEQRTLELKSQLYAGIGIMAGSYAHNIKNLLVRPNDLLSRCLEADGLSSGQERMLSEVRETLGTVTERLQQILKTVRRDPTRSETTRLDLNAIVDDIRKTWEELAREKWKLTLTEELAPEALWIDGDTSHLQQAVENLLFNARDATFEMRNHLREQARRQEGLSADQRRQALINAAAWKGTVALRVQRVGDKAVLEVRDNGVGMTEEVRRRCTETHFTTKRNNAVYEGNTTGMGLGLSFVLVVLEHHGAALEIDTQPLQGALFRAIFPLSGTMPVNTNGEREVGIRSA
jgi:signal transduction histidine kinase